MSINAAISTNMLAAQVGFTQSLDAESTQLNQLPLQGENTAAETTGARSTTQTQSGKAAQQTTTAQQSTETAAQPQTQQNTEVANRTLRLALTDNSKQLQAQFGKNNEAGQTGQTGQQQSTMGAEARRTVMLRNLESMVNMQLAQYTGNEPYSKANYRQILGALGNMQGGGSTSKTDESKSSTATDNAEAAGEGEKTDGAYKLYSGQAAKTLAVLTPNANKHSANKEGCDYVA